MTASLTAGDTQEKDFFLCFHFTASLLPLQGPSENLLIRRLKRFSFVTNTVKTISCEEKMSKKQSIVMRPLLKEIVLSSPGL